MMTAYTQGMGQCIRTSHGKLFVLMCCAYSFFCCDAVGVGGCQNAMKPIDLLSKIDLPDHWAVIGKPETYIGQKLIDYINGGAELYFAYKFKELTVTKYQIDTDRVVTMEIYQMDRAENAYGVFSFDTDGEHPDIGQGAAYSNGLLKFWKGEYFVRIFTSDTSMVPAVDLYALGSAIASAVQFTGNAPRILTTVPMGRLVPESIHYFHENVCLNNFYYLSDENILNFTSRTEAITYEYEIEYQILRVILIQYPERGDAVDAYESFIGAYFADLTFNKTKIQDGAEHIQEVEEGKYSGIKVIDHFLILVFEAETKSACMDMLEKQCASLK